MKQLVEFDFHGAFTIHYSLTGKSLINYFIIIFNSNFSVHKKCQEYVDSRKPWRKKFSFFNHLGIDLQFSGFKTSIFPH